jgi:hypothetical protein
MKNRLRSFEVVSVDLNQAGNSKVKMAIVRQIQCLGRKITFGADAAK